MYLASSHMRTLQQYFVTAYTEEQRSTLQKEFMHAAADAIDAVVFTADALFNEQRREIEELRAKIEQPIPVSKPTPPVTPSPVIADVKISKESIQQLRNDLTKAFKNWFLT